MYWMYIGSNFHVYFVVAKHDNGSVRLSLFLCVLEFLNYKVLFQSLSFGSH